MPESLPERMREHMPERLPDRKNSIQNIHLTYDINCQAVCQKLCQNNVSGRGTLEERICPSTQDPLTAAKPEDLQHASLATGPQWRIKVGGTGCSGKCEPSWISWGPRSQT